jgi:hypothetical protein
MPESWSPFEVEAIVSDYFRMLVKENAGVPYSKADHRRALLPLLQNRTEGSVEFKHQNISAVLAKYGMPYINGYKPAWNYQKMLEEVVLARIPKEAELEKSFEVFASAVPLIQYDIAFNAFEQSPPEMQPISPSEPGIIYRTPVKINYIDREQSNKVIGNTGEKLVVEYEKWRLINAGKESFADQIEWVADTQGDGLGFDILSKNVNGTDRYIEVKSTKLTKEAPFYFSQNELMFSREKKSNYHLYRVFNLKDDPKVFVLNGSFDEFCNYQAVKFKGYF